MSAIDHKAEAVGQLAAVEPLWVAMRDGENITQTGVNGMGAITALAQVHATLALVEQQRIANLIAFAHSKWESGNESIVTDESTVMRVREIAFKGLGL